MSLLMVAKDKSSSNWYVVTQGCVPTEYGLKRYESQRRYRIQKFKHFLVAYDCSGYTASRVFSEIDFDKITTPITKGVLYSEFYLKLIEILIKTGDVEINEDSKELTNFKADFVFICKDEVFDIFGRRIYHPDDFCASGEDSIAFALYDNLEGKLPTKDLLLTIYKESMKVYKTIGYPIHIATSNSDNLEVIEEDGSVHYETLKQNWKGCDEDDISK